MNLIYVAGFSLIAAALAYHFIEKRKNANCVPPKKGIFIPTSPSSNKPGTTTTMTGHFQAALGGTTSQSTAAAGDPSVYQTEVEASN